jgi:hypothetical protein
MDLLSEVFSYVYLLVILVAMIVAFTWQPRKGKWPLCVFLLLTFLSSFAARLLNILLRMDILTWSDRIEILFVPGWVLSNVSLVFLLWFAFASRRVGAAAVSYVAEIPSAGADVTLEGVDPKLVGIGGWLILPAIGLVLGGVLSVVGLAISVANYEWLVDQGYDAYFGVSICIDFGMFIFLLVAAVLFFGKKRSAPGAMIGLMVANIVSSIIVTTVAFGTHEEQLVLLSAKSLASGIVSAAIWIPYFCVSKRVKATFVN